MNAYKEGKLTQYYPAKSPATSHPTIPSYNYNLVFLF